MPDLHKILYVEDDPDIREIAILALEDVGGFTLKVCSSGEIALQQINAFEPQLVLLDVMMPGMDGPETLAAMRDAGEITENMLVIFMTAKVHPEEIQRYKLLGVDYVIAKPFDAMTLSDEIRTLWNERYG